MAANFQLSFKLSMLHTYFNLVHKQLITNSHVQLCSEVQKCDSDPGEKFLQVSSYCPSVLFQSYYRASKAHHDVSQAGYCYANPRGS